MTEANNTLSDTYFGMPGSPVETNKDVEAEAAREALRQELRDAIEAALYDPADLESYSVGVRAAAEALAPLVEVTAALRAKADAGVRALTAAVCYALDALEADGEDVL